MSLEGLLLGDRYRILRYIGEGGMSRVYKAEDTIDNTLVAVKFIKENATSHYLEDIIRFKKEIETASRLNHPGIARISGSGEYNGLPYTVMELIEGEGLDLFIEEIYKNNPGFERITEYFYQLTEILEYVHKNGIVHRDIKPGNIFVCRENDIIRFKLLDFGVAHIMELSEINIEKEIAGTFGYMSPEATGQLNGCIDERSDLYSLGVIFYQFLTGNLPFKGKDIGKLLHQQVAADIIPPESVNPAVPDILGKITMKLLMKDPDSRYQSANGLLYDIKRVLEGEVEFTPGCLDRKVKLTYRTRMIGREDEMKKITSLFEKASLGNGSICLIGGEAGTGKSKLLDELKKYLEKQGARFISSRCLNHRNKTPYQPFHDAMDEYINKLEKYDKKTRQKEVSEFRRKNYDFGEILVRLNPRIKELLGDTKQLVSLEPERETQRFLNVLSDFFIWLAEGEGGCVLLLDDLQWADEGTLMLLAEIAARIENSKLLIVGTFRDNDIYDADRIMNFSAKLPYKDTVLVMLKLKKLEQTDISRLAVCLLGDTEEEIVNISEYLYDKSGGNPFFVVNILRELVENHIIYNKEDRWKLDTGRLEGLPVSTGIVDVILMRIGKIDTSQKELLCKAAIIGREFDMDLLHRLLNCSFEELVERIDQSVSMQFLETSSSRGRFLFAHDRIRDEFSNMMDAEEKRSVHKDILQSLEILNRDECSNVVFELAHHAIEADNQDRIVKYAIPAADKARLSYANEEAIRFYTVALEILEKKVPKDSIKWVGCNENLIELFLLTGRNDEAVAIAEKILPDVGTTFGLATLYKKIGAAYHKKADWEKCEKNIIQAMKLLGESFPAGKTELTASIVKQLSIYMLNRIKLKKTVTSKYIKDLEGKKEVIWMYETLNWMYVFTNVTKCFYITLAALNLAEKIGVSRELGTSLCNYAAAYMILPMFKRALKHHKKALQIRRNIADEWGVAKSLQLLGSNYLWEGDYKNSIQSLEESSLGFQRIGDSWESGLVYVELMRLYIYTADYKKSLHYGGLHFRECTKAGNIYGINAAKLGKVNCYIETGDFDEASVLLDEILISTSENNLQFLFCYALAYYGSLNLERDQYKLAIDYLDHARQIFMKNRFLKDYIVFLFPHLAEAYLKQLRKTSLENGKKPSTKEILKARTLCIDALKKTKPWPNHYGTSLRAAAELYALISKNEKADKLYLKSIEHEEKLSRKYEAAKGYYEYGLFLKSNSGLANAQQTGIQPIKTLSERSLPEDALMYLQKAYKLFADIGAKANKTKCELVLKLYEGEKMGDRNTARERLQSDRRMSTVLTAGKLISSILEPDILLEKVMDEVIQLVGADNGVLLLYPEEGEKQLQVMVSRNMLEEGVIHDSTKVSNSIIQKVEREKISLLTTDAQLEENFRNMKSVLLNDIKSVICTPIMVKGELMGVIYLGNNQLHGLFDEYDLDIVAMLAGQAGVSLQNARMFSKLKLYAGEIERSRDEISQWNKKLENRVVERTAELNEKNRELSYALEKLKEHADMVEELAVTKERNRFAMDAHDNLGHTMTLLIKLLEVSRLTCLKDSVKMESQLIEASRIAREGLEQLRSSVKGLITNKISEYNLDNSLKGLAENFEALGVHVELSVQGLKGIKEPMYISTLYNLCMEAMTNALRHGKAENISIIMKKEEGLIKLVIFDDGHGCGEITKGFGLSSMEKRVEALNGSISFSSGEEGGFIIRIEIPALEGNKI